jgi:N-methylhydantoinase A
MPETEKWSMRLSVDVGGTFTDLVVDDGDGHFELHKASTTSPDPIDGVLRVLGVAATERGMTLRQFLATADAFIHGTTRAINAVVTGNTAKTAFLVTAGHPDVLLIREGGRTDPFNYRVPYPEPYVPRALTFEVPERIGAAGDVVQPLDEAEVRRIAAALKERKVEAVAVCFLWSIVNPAHELRTGELLRQILGGIALTLSHQLNPTLREYRRASSCCIDASLKPIMSAYLRDLQQRLKQNGLAGRAFAVTSQGGIADISAMAERPILSLNSGPSMAPVAGRHYARRAGGKTAIITDAGGTTYDVSLVRNGAIPWTRETWIGPIHQGHMTGFPSVDVKSIGAGGGSIAYVDLGGMLHVGPASAGSDPGPACYARGGTRPTVTDAAVALGYIDPEYFLGGRMKLAVDAAVAAINAEVATPLGLSVDDAALAIIDLATEAMVNAIEEITVKQGIDPEDTVMIGGGGASGLNGVAIARRLRCKRIVFPDVGAALSAAGAVMSELRAEFAHTEFMRTKHFDCERANRVLAELKEQAQAGSMASLADEGLSVIDCAIEGRYQSQVWEIEVALRDGMFAGEADVQQLVKDFHARHVEIFGFADDGDEIEIVGWRAVCRTRIADIGEVGRVKTASRAVARQHRPMTFREVGRVESASYDLGSLSPGERLAGPAIVESSFTTIVLHPGAHAERRADGAFIVDVHP